MVVGPEAAAGGGWGRRILWACWTHRPASRRRRLQAPERRYGHGRAAEQHLGGLPSGLMRAGSSRRRSVGAGCCGRGYVVRRAFNTRCGGGLSRHPRPRCGAGRPAVVRLDPRRRVCGARYRHHHGVPFSVALSASKVFGPVLDLHASHGGSRAACVSPIIGAVLSSRSVHEGSRLLALGAFTRVHWWRCRTVRGAAHALPKAISMTHLA